MKSAILLIFIFLFTNNSFSQETENTNPLKPIEVSHRVMDERSSFQPGIVAIVDDNQFTFKVDKAIYDEHNFKKLHILNWNDEDFGNEETINEHKAEFLHNSFHNKILNTGKEKSPVLGAIMSGIIPGSGEIYAQSYIKGAIFAVAEVGLWLLKINFDKKGDDQTIKFQNYADAHWDIYKYAAWLKAENFPGAQNINETEPDREILRQQVNEVERVNFSHTLPEFGAQQYYEVIGKYNSFFAGWSFIPSNSITRNNWFDYESVDVDNYMSERQQANNYYDNASLAVTGVIINHLLSAADAAWTVSMFNNDIKVKTGMEFKSLYSNNHNRRMLVPFGNLSITF
ncbi:MAG TPA: hypothetical protein VHP32_07510 [Ignavibacteria bacterium]|nr:hypothetical protein [Ignavibacteria bacterium]